MPAAKRFLVIDDEPICNLISKHLILQINPEADIKIFTDPEKALEYIQAEAQQEEEAVDTILLLDINMPFMTGWEFLEEFEKVHNASHKRFSIYIVSSSIEENDKEQADRHALVSGFLSKPLTADTLANIL